MNHLKRDIVLREREFRLIVIGDVHVGDGLSDLKLFEKTIRYVKNTPNCYCILNGDLMNNALKNSKSDIYAATMTIEEQQEYLIKTLMPIRDRILVISTGNHERRTMRDVGINPLKYIAKSLKVPDLLVENAFIIDISVLNERTKNRENGYVIHGIHGGHGGGRRMGTTANALEDMSRVIANADLYVHSHTHSPIYYTDNILIYYTQLGGFSEKLRTFVNGNAFLKYGGYAEEKGYKLVDRTPIVLVVKQINDKNKTRKMITDVIRIC